MGKEKNRECLGKEKRIVYFSLAISIETSLQSSNSNDEV
jgi:hypothetical protein